MDLTNYVVVIGQQTTITELTEQLCKELGIQVFHAMKLQNPNERISSLEDECIVVPSLNVLPETTFVEGMLVPDLMLGDVVDNIYSENRQIFASPLLCYVNRMQLKSDIPKDWTVEEFDADHQSSNLPIGTITIDGQIVVAIEGKKVFMQIPDHYQTIFSLIQGYH